MALPTTNLSLNAIHVEVGGTSGTQVSLNDADVRGIGNPNATYAGSDGINTTSGSQISIGEFRGATDSWSATVTVGYMQGEVCVKTCSYYDNYGYQAISGANYGSLSDTSLEYLSGTPTVNGIYWTELSTQLVLMVSGTVANSGWTTLTIGSTSYSRASSLHNQSSGNTTWTWGSVNSPATNAFGTTTGATKTITIQ